MKNNWVIEEKAGGGGKKYIKSCYMLGCGMMMVVDITIKNSTFAPHFAKITFNYYLIDYESIRNRFHFDSRFV